MSTSITGTGVTFSDSSVQTTAPKLLGISQAYSSPSRAFGTTYTNSGSKPILVSVIGFTTEVYGLCAISLFVNGARIQYFDHTPDASGILRLTVSCIVPAGATYQVTVTNLTLEAWRELS